MIDVNDRVRVGEHRTSIVDALARICAAVFLLRIAVKQITATNVIIIIYSRALPSPVE